MPGSRSSKLGGPVKAGHHCLKRIFLIQETILVRANDAIVLGGGGRLPILGS